MLSFPPSGAGGGWWSRTPLSPTSTRRQVSQSVSQSVSLKFLFPKKIMCMKQIEECFESVTGITLAQFINGSLFFVITSYNLYTSCNVTYIICIHIEI